MTALPIPERFQEAIDAVAMPSRES